MLVVETFVDGSVRLRTGLRVDFSVNVTESVGGDEESFVVEAGSVDPVEVGLRIDWGMRGSV